MAETVIVLYLSHFWSEFDEILYAEIFLPTWKTYQFSSRSHRLQGQRPQGHKGQRPKNFEINFFRISLICESIAPTFEAQYPQYHSTYWNCQLCFGHNLAFQFVSFFREEILSYLVLKHNKVTIQSIKNEAIKNTNNIVPMVRNLLVTDPEILVAKIQVRMLGKLLLPKVNSCTWILYFRGMPRKDQLRTHWNCGTGGLNSTL